MIIRKANKNDAISITKVHVDTWRKAHLDILPKEFIEKSSYDKQYDKWNNKLNNINSNELIYVAESDEGNVIGFAYVTIDKTDSSYDATLDSIYVMEQYQKLGVGISLIRSVVSTLIESGVRSMILWIIDENPACSFYERLGAKIVHKKTVKMGNKELVEVAYVWEDINEIL